MLRFFKVTAIVFLVFITGFSPASNASIVNSGTSGGITAPNLTIPGVGGPTLTSGKLCEIKQLFCGNTAMAMVAFAIFLMGIMILNQKLQWHNALLIFSGIIIFYNADKVALLFNSNILVLPGNCSC